MQPHACAGGFQRRGVGGQDCCCACCAGRHGGRAGQAVQPPAQGGPPAAAQLRHGCAEHGRAGGRGSRLEDRRGAPLLWRPGLAYAWRMWIAAARAEVTATGVERDCACAGHHLCRSCCCKLGTMAGALPWGLCSAAASPGPSAFGQHARAVAPRCCSLDCHSLQPCMPCSGEAGA